jgi:hypothetical protein
MITRSRVRQSLDADSPPVGLVAVHAMALATLADKALHVRAVPTAQPHAELARHLVASLRDQLLSDRLRRRLSTIAHTEFALRLLQVAAHGLCTKFEDLGDLFSSPSHRHEPQNS